MLWSIAATFTHGSISYREWLLDKYIVGILGIFLINWLGIQDISWYLSQTHWLHTSFHHDLVKTVLSFENTVQSVLWNIHSSRRTAVRHGRYPIYTILRCTFFHKIGLKNACALELDMKPRSQLFQEPTVSANVIISAIIMATKLASLKVGLAVTIYNFLYEGSLKKEVTLMLSWRH